MTQDYVSRKQWKKHLTPKLARVVSIETRGMPEKGLIKDRGLSLLKYLHTWMELGFPMMIVLYDHMMRGKVLNIYTLEGWQLYEDNVINVFRFGKETGWKCNLVLPDPGK